MSTFRTPTSPYSAGSSNTAYQSAKKPPTLPERRASGARSAHVPSRALAASNHSQPRRSSPAYITTAMVAAVAYTNVAMSIACSLYFQVPVINRQ